MLVPAAARLLAFPHLFKIFFAFGACILLGYIAFESPAISRITEGGLRIHETPINHQSPPFHVEPINRHQLLHLKLTDDFEYRRQCIRPHQNPDLVREDRSIFKASGHLITKATSHKAITLLDHNSMTDISACQQPLILEVPLTISNQHVDQSRLMLGTVTTINRLIVALPLWASYLAGSETRIAVMVRDEHDPQSPAVQRAKDLAFSLKIDMELVCEAELLEGDALPTHFTEGHSNFEIILALMHYKHSNTEWFGIVDDDTFINSVPDILDHLDIHDSSQEYYIGSMTESRVQAKKWGFMAYGGGGFFLSLPLLENLYASFTECLGFHANFGDQLWSHCIMDVCGVNLTENQGFHQLDFRGTMDGWYEAGMWPLLTVHHWKTYHHTPVPQVHAVTAVAGTESFLARFTFDDKNVVFTNGFSIVKYPQGIPDLSQTEVTWETAAEELGAMTEEWSQIEPIRLQLPEEEKESWLLEYAVRNGKTVTQYYVRRGHIDSVIQLDWSP